MNPTLDSIVEQALAETEPTNQEVVKDCLLYTSDAATILRV